MGGFDDLKEHKKIQGAPLSSIVINFVKAAEE